MAVAVGAERRRRVVDVQRAEPVEPDDAVELVEHRGERLRGADVVARGEQVAGVEADAEPLVAARRPRSAARAPRTSARASRPRPRCPPGAAGTSSDSASASAITSPARSIAASTAPPSLSAEPGCSTTACAPSAAPARSEVVSDASDFSRISRVLGRAVEQVDGVDQQRVDVGVRHRGAEVGDLLVGVLARLPRARVLVEDLDRARAALDAALDGLGRTAGGGDVGTDQHGAGRF